MSQAKRINEKSTTVLLKTSAKLISRERAYLAPSIDREEWAEIVEDGLRVGLIPEEKVMLEIDALTQLLESFVDRRGEPCAGEKNPDTSMGAIALATSILIAADVTIASPSYSSTGA